MNEILAIRFSTFMLDFGLWTNDNVSSSSPKEILGACVIVTHQEFVSRIWTMNGRIVGNIVIEAKDQYDAERELSQRYRDCDDLNCGTP